MSIQVFVHVIIYIFIAVQMAGWAWMMKRAGHFSDRKFLIFSGMMLLGQLGSMVDAIIMDDIMNSAWGVVASQFYFFCWTAYGGYKRYSEMRLKC